MIAANRCRLCHLAQQGNRGARQSLELLARTNRLLGGILLFNNLINSARRFWSASSPSNFLAKTNGRLALALWPSRLPF